MEYALDVIEFEQEYERCEEDENYRPESSCYLRSITSPRNTTAHCITLLEMHEPGNWKLRWKITSDRIVFRTFENKDNGNILTVVTERRFSFNEEYNIYLYNIDIQSIFDVITRIIDMIKFILVDTTDTLHYTSTQ